MSEENEKKENEEKGGEGKVYDQAYVDSLITEATVNRKKYKDVRDQLDLQKQEQEKKEQERAEKNGEFETLFTQAKDENTQLKAQVEKLSGSVEIYKKRDLEELGSLLPNIPEDLRGDVSDESIPLATRLNLARKLAGRKGKLADYRGPGEEEFGEITKKSDLKTPAEKAAFIHKHGGSKYLALA